MGIISTLFGGKGGVAVGEFGVESGVADES